MTTSAKNNFRRAFVPTTALAQAVHCDDQHLVVTLTDGRQLSVPLIWFPRLHSATAEQRAQCEISVGGRGLYWPEIDEDISIAGLMAGADRQSA